VEYNISAQDELINKALSLDLDIEDWFFILKASQGHKVPQHI